MVVLSILSLGGSLTSFEAQYALFAQMMPWRFQHCEVIWIYLQSATLWTLWVVYNDTVFNQERWPHAKLEGTIWTNLTDYGRAAWLCLQKKKLKNVASCIEAIGNFMAIWTVNGYLFKRDKDRILWNHFTFDPRGDLV